MDEISILLNCGLFKGIKAEDIKKIIKEYGCYYKSYTKGQYVLIGGQKPDTIGIVTNGCLTAQKTTLEGQLFTVTNIKPCQVFGDILAGSHNLSPVTILALSDSNVLHLPFASLIKPHSTENYCHTLLRNLTSTVADKYFALDKRLNLLLEKNLRLRILSYLKEKAAPIGSFSHNLTRQQLADYLGCDRAALCRELSRMKHDSLIDYNKHCFTVF